METRKAKQASNKKENTMRKPEDLTALNYSDPKVQKACQSIDGYDSFALELLDDAWYAIFANSGNTRKQKKSMRLIRKAMGALLEAYGISPEQYKNISRRHHRNLQDS